MVNLKLSAKKMNEEFLVAQLPLTYIGDSLTCLCVCNVYGFCLNFALLRGMGTEVCGRDYKV
jgi:hypothetical protein